jgi:hypothetical protein
MLMRKIFLLCALVLVTGTAYIAWRYVQPEHYGRPFSGAPQVALQDLARPDSPAFSQDVRIEGKIVRQCPATGCWFYLDDGKGNRHKVELGKVVPSLPQKLGHRATVEGRMVLMGDEPVFAGNGVEFQR